MKSALDLRISQEHSKVIFSVCHAGKAGECLVFVQLHYFHCSKVARWSLQHWERILNVYQIVFSLKLVAQWARPKALNFVGLCSSPCMTQEDSHDPQHVMLLFWCKFYKINLYWNWVNLQNAHAISLHGSGSNKACFESKQITLPLSLPVFNIRNLMWNLAHHLRNDLV